MSKCNFCGKDAGYLPFKCNYCGLTFCKKHRLQENHDCVGVIVEDIVKPTVPEENGVSHELDKREDDTFIIGEIEQEPLKIVEKKLEIHETIPAWFQMKVIKDHRYEIRWFCDKSVSVSTSFGITINDNDINRYYGYGTMANERSGKYRFIHHKTEIVTIDAYYPPRWRDWPRIKINLKIIDLGFDDKDIEIYMGIKIKREEREVLLELEKKYLGEPIPVVNKLENYSFGVVIKDRHIISLSLYDKDLYQLPNSIWKLKYLKRLNLSNNPLSFLPEIEENYWHYDLKELNLSYCSHLTTLPKNLLKLKGLKILNLSHCSSLSSLPDLDPGRSYFEFIEYLDISYCNFCLMPKFSKFGSGSYKKIDLRGNPFTFEERKKIQNSEIVLIESVYYFLDTLMEKIKDNSANDHEFFENLIFSVLNDPLIDIRAAASKILVLDYFNQASNQLEKIIQEENSSLIIITIYKSLKSIKSKKAKELMNKIVDKYSKIYKVVPTEAFFFIDLETIQLDTWDQYEFEQFSIKHQNKFYKQMGYPLELLEKFKRENYLKVGNFGDLIHRGPYNHLNEKMHENEFYSHISIDNNHVKGLDLDFYGIFIREIPESIHSLSELEYLDIGNINLDDIQLSTAQFKKLKVINGVKIINSGSNKDSLKEVLTSNIAQKYLQESIEPNEAKVLAALKISGASICKEKNNQGNIISLQVRFNDEDSREIFISEEIDSFKHLMKLEITGNNIKTIPESIGNLTNLKTLTLRCGKLKKIPETIGSLIKLEKLDLEFNKLKNIPDVIGNLRNLKRLILNKNCILKISNSIENLTKLEILDCDENNIENLPKSIGSLSSLKILKLNSNCIRELPNSIGNLKNLQTLELYDNHISKLPESIIALKSLKIFDLSRNILFDVPESLDTFLNSLEEYKK